MSRLIRFSVFTFTLLLTIAIPALGQDFSRTYPLGPEGTISIHNISGNVRAVGYDGQAVIVTAYREGRDREVVEIVDRSSANRVDVKVRYPEECNCDASVRFEVQIPRSIPYRFDSLSSISGNVSVTNVTGNLKAKSISGSVTVKNIAGTAEATSVSGEVTVEEAAGAVSAKSTSGDVKVDMTNMQGSDRLEFSSISGNVSVRLPANADAEVEMSVMTGGLKTDFPLQIEDRGFGPGKRAHGFIGAGARKMKLSSVSGNVSLTRL